MRLAHKASLALAFLTVGSLASARPAAAQHIYDASADFSTTSNPSPLDGGVFSYGSETTLGGSFLLDAQTFTFTGSVSGVVQGWTNATGFPATGKNISSTMFISNQNGSTITLAPNQLDFHPGPNGEFSVLRFKAPTTSTFSFLSNFNGADSHPTTTDVHVLLNNRPLA